MKFLASFLASLVLFLAPVGAFSKPSAWTPSDVENLVRSTGCKAPITTSPNVSIFGSMYVPAGVSVFSLDDTDRIYIGIQPGVDDDIMRDIILHESDHCLQFEYYGTSPSDYASDPVKYELEADRYAADKLCRMGYDGKAITIKTLQYAHDTFGYNGDENHGTLEQRMSQANNAPACAALQTA